MDSPPPAVGPPATRPRWGLHLGLFVATCATTTLAGARFSNGGMPLADIIPRLGDGLPFSISLMGILLTHEMGHYVFARIHRVDASLPYFIPLPFLGVGTFGAVIRMRSAIKRRNALVDIGAAGPLAGLVVAIPVLIYGIGLSEIRPVGPGQLEGNSLLYLLLKYLVTGKILPGGGVDVVLHSVAWAGWVGLLVTMINLMPIGQLDGGHIAFAFFGTRQNRASSALHRALLPMGLGAAVYSAYQLARKWPLAPSITAGVMSGAPWLIWFGLLFWMRRVSGGQYHPPVDDSELSRGRRWLCIGMLLVFVMIFTPIPLRLTA